MNTRVLVLQRNQLHMRSVFSPLTNFDAVHFSNVSAFKSYWRDISTYVDAVIADVQFFQQDDTLLPELTSARSNHSGARHVSPIITTGELESDALILSGISSMFINTAVGIGYSRTKIIAFIDNVRKLARNEQELHAAKKTIDNLKEEIEALTRIHGLIIKESQNYFHQFKYLEKSLPDLKIDTNTSNYFLTASEANSYNLVRKLMPLLYEKGLHLQAIQQNGEFPLEITAVDIRSFAKDFEDRMKPAFDRKQIKFDVSVAPNVEAVFHTDIIKMDTVLSNLAGNALKFTPQGGDVQVYLSYDIVDERNYLKTEVKDSGPGMLQKEIELIGTVRGKTTLGTQGEIGTGFGMEMSRCYVAALKGLWRPVSEIGKGCNFCFLLPAYILPNPPVQKEDHFRKFPVKMLIVEDDDMAFNQFSDLAGDLLGNNVIIKDAMSGNDAIETIKQNDFDIIFLDQFLINGEDSHITTLPFIRDHINKNNLHTKVIGISANGGIFPGYDDSLPKPVNKIDFYKVIRRILRNFGFNL